MEAVQDAVVHPAPPRPPTVYRYWYASTTLSGDTDAHGLLAHSLYNRNKKREALGAAERAVKLNPKLADAYVIIGGVRQEGGDVEEARRAYQRYLELEPKGSFAADLRAIINRLPAKL